MLILLYFVVLLCFVYLFYIYTRYVPSDCGTVATVPGKLPVFGHAMRFAALNDIFHYLVYVGNHAAKNGDIVKIFLGPCPIYVIADPDDALVVLNKCLDKMFIYFLIEPLFGKGLVAADVPVWKRNRRILDAAFKPHVLDSYIGLYNSQALILTEKLSNDIGKYVDLTDSVTRNVLETAWQTTMGESNDKNVISDNYVQAIHDVLEIVTIKALKPWLMVDFIFEKSANGRKFNKALDVAHSQTHKIVKQRLAEYAAGEIQGKDRKFKSYLEILIENNSGPNGCLFSYEELSNLVDNILLASFDTTSYALLFSLICIGTYPDVQEKIHQEFVFNAFLTLSIVAFGFFLHFNAIQTQPGISDVLGKEETVTREHLGKLVYLEAAIKEALRLYPIGPVIGRQADRTGDCIQLKNHTLPSGSLMGVHIWAINRHKKLWGQDADEYKPERWLDPTSLPNHPAAFATFSPGRRGCIGKSFAMMYLKLTLVPMLRKYRLTADHKNMNLMCYIMLKPVSGHLVKIELR